MFPSHSARTAHAGVASFVGDVAPTTPSSEADATLPGAGEELEAVGGEGNARDQAYIPGCGSGDLGWVDEAGRDEIARTSRSLR